MARLGSAVVELVGGEGGTAEGSGGGKSCVRKGGDWWCCGAGLLFWGGIWDRARLTGILLEPQR